MNASVSLRQAPVHPLLRLFVSELWAQAPACDAALPAPGLREHVLPTGAMHLAIRLGATPLCVFSADAPAGREYGHAVLGGARDAYYVKAITGPAVSVGAQLRPGAARALFGVAADELVGRHVPLEALCGQAAANLRERLQALTTPAQRLALLEGFLLARLPAVRGLHPAVAQALTECQQPLPVAEQVARSGYSHRRFIALFAEAVGLTPKRYQRVLRFQRVLTALAAQPTRPWADLAAAAGYSDQAHFVRAFREHTGVTPQRYRLAAPPAPNHLQVNFLQDRPMVSD